jgi:hypothetical protein
MNDTTKKRLIGGMAVMVLIYIPYYIGAHYPGPHFDFVLVVCIIAIIFIWAVCSLT